MRLWRFEYRDAMAYDLTDLELFLQVVDRGSITQGAERAHLSLASASARITAMEKALANCWTATGVVWCRPRRVVAGRTRPSDRRSAGPHAHRAGSLPRRAAINIGDSGEDIRVTQTLVPTALATFWQPTPTSTSSCRSARATRSSWPSLTGAPSSESSPTQWTRLGWPGAELDDRTQRRTPNC